MALTSVYYDGPVTESDRAENRTGAPDYGVYGVDDFKVTAHPSIPYAVLVKKGRAHGHGVTDEAVDDQVVQCASLTSGVRWDLIVVRRNWQPALGGPSTLAVIQVGSGPAIPDPPIRKVGPGVEDDQPIFLVKWQGGTSAPVDFIDLRVWTGNGGLYAKNDLVRTYMEKAGTEINVNGVIWHCQLGTNDALDWRQISSIESTVGKPADVPWRQFKALISAPGGTDGNGYGELRFGQNGMPVFSGIAAVQLTGFHPVEGFMFVPSVQDYSTTRVRFRARRLDNSGWANGYGSISLFVDVLGW